MSSRGRGFSSRGGGSSYRGRGGGGGEWSGGSSSGNVSRGGYSSSRGGRFKYSTPSYDSRNKYASSGSERYSSRGGRGDHSNNYKRPRDSYSSRDDHRSSSESTRKRVRNDSYQGESGSSQRYSSSYGGSASSVPYDNKRSSSSAVYDDKRQSDRQSSYHRADDRHSASRGYAVPPPPRISEMAPPSQRYTSTTRGRVSHQSTNYRGRLSVRGRGTSFRSSRADILLARKRNLTTNLDYRRKLLASRSRDYIQRVRMTTAKMRRSSATTRISGSKKDSGSGSTIKDKDRELAKAINAEFSDDDDEEKDAEENWDEDEKMPLVGEENEEDSEAQEKKPKDDKKKKEKPEHKNAEDNEKDDEEKEDDEDETKAEGEDEEEAEGEGDENEKEEGRESDGAGNKRNGKRFIKLQCPHCSHRSTRFKEYSLHLYSGRHNNAMRRIAARHKTTLARMRVVQRQEQRKLEAKDAARGNLPSRTMFCQICKLNYRSVKALHHLSDSHRQMKRFLTPSCRVCRVQFRSPMLYETHVASLDHIKKKNSADDKVNGGNAEAEGDSSAPEEDDKEVNLDNFMTLDSVGDVDEEGDDTIEKKKKEKPEGETTPPDVERKLKTKQMIKVGAEYIKKVEVQFCELCKIYLPRNECSERTLAMHCSTRSHLKRYVRDNDDKALRRQAERIHLQTSTTTINTSTNSTSPTEAVKTSLENSIETPAPENSTSNDVEETSEAPPVNETEPVVAAVETNAKLSQGEAEEEEEDDFRGDGGDKLWDDVDKDLGDILREAEPGKSSDDEDSRYDRFRNSDKKKQAILLSKEKNSEQPEPEETPKKLEMKIKTEKVEN